MMKMPKNENKNCNFQNKKDGFIYSIYYFTKPYTNFLVGIDSKRARGGRWSYSTCSINSKIYNTLTPITAIKTAIIAPLTHTFWSQVIDL